ncbi:GNAT family N-acetyltransferase [Paenibacillus sp. FSL K6-1230]|uniref:GNAT family N-acetyltransferase n=1 Tax=Paenibacillus sp. FSL K6-1230 TaxID=2921603 RepID=UPI0030FB7F10
MDKDLSKATNQNTNEDTNEAAIEVSSEVSGKKANMADTGTATEKARGLQDNIQLRRMNGEEYERFIKRLIQDYAADKVQAGTWTEEEAPRLAEESLHTYLPQGLDTPDAYLYVITLREQQGDEQGIGIIWFNITDTPVGPEAFILEFWIEDAYQGQGYAKQTLRALDEEARNRGIRKIGLHVFGHNTRAFELYKKRGYVVTDIQMSKEL